MRRKLIAANWKMNKTIDQARSYADGLRGRAGELNAVDLLIVPPFFAVPAVARALAGTPVAVGVQNVYYEESGAFTGEVSATMSAEAGATVALVGHSERRHVFGESNATVARKFTAVLAAGLTPILCVGETLDERESGRAEQVVDTQIGSALDGHGADEAIRAVLAYEPVWAIGTGRTASPDDAGVMHRFIRSRVSERYGPEIAERIRIQYGGSVKPENAAALLAIEDIDGALVGGASLEVNSFVEIALAAPGA